MSRQPQQVKGLSAAAKALRSIADLKEAPPLVCAFLHDSAVLVEQAAGSLLEFHTDLKVERQKNKELRQLCRDMAKVIKNDDDTFRRLREVAQQELAFDFIGSYDESLGKVDQLPLFEDRIRKLRIRR